jgi:hypothetical protein
MKRLCITVFLLAGCSGDGGAGDRNESAAAPVIAQSAVPAPAALASLVGLYEGPKAAQTDQMCVVEKGGETRFGLVVWGGNLHSCSGSGTVTRRGDTLRLAMTGDEACTIDARISGKTVLLPATVPHGCSYYCGARATLANVAFTQKGATTADAKKAKDLVGESLCVSE